LQESSEAFQHPPLRIVTFPNASSNKTTENQASLQDELLLSPLPYEHHLDFSRDDGRSKKKRSRWTQSEYSSFLKCLDEQMDDITGTSSSVDIIKTEPTYDDTPDTTSNDKDSERHTNREFLSATLNFPYKEFISKDGKDHIKIWNDDEEQVRLERHFNPKWQVDFLSTFYGPEGSIRQETVVTPTNTTTIESSSPPCYDTMLESSSNKRFKKCNNEKEDITSTTKSFSRGGQNTGEVILLDPVNDSKENTKLPDEDHDIPSPFSGQEDIKKAALNLCDAMDITDLSRDYIARFERNINFNRREFLSSKFHFGLE
jgi:hypothetical protein